MSEITLTVPAEYIAVLKLFAPINDVRYYLNGINLEISAQETRLIATDGARIGVFRLQVEQPTVTTPLSDIIIPNDLLKLVKTKGNVTFTLGECAGKEDNARPVTVACAGGSLVGATINGVFPDYRRVIPATVTGAPHQFDLCLLGDIGKAWRLLHGGKGPCQATIGFNGEGRPALFDLGIRDFVGVIAPLRIFPEPLCAPPSWATDELSSSTDLV